MHYLTINRVAPARHNIHLVDRVIDIEIANFRQVFSCK